MSDIGGVSHKLYEPLSESMLLTFFFEPKADILSTKLVEGREVVRIHWKDGRRIRELSGGG